MPEQPKFSADIVKADKRSRFNPLKDLTADKLTTYLDEFRAGHLRNLALVMEAMEERDDTLASVVPKAKSAVARHGFEVLTVDTESDAAAALAQEQKAVLEHFYNNVRATSAMDQDETGGLSLLLRQMMDAKGKRYSCHNIVWEPQRNGRYGATFHHVPLWFFENTEGRMRFINTPYGIHGETMEPGEWLVTKGQGIMIACSVAWMFKHLPLRDWLIYCSRHGMPGIEGATDAAEGSDEWNALVTAVTQAATEFAWVRSRTSEINTIQFGAQGEIPFPKLVERMDRAMAALWRGADLSTISKGEGLGASLQGGEADIIEQDDAQWLSEILNYKIDPLVLGYVFPRGTPTLAYVKVLTSTKDNIDQELKIDEFAVRNGHPVSSKQFAERYNRPVPDDDDTLLTPRPSAAAPGLSGLFGDVRTPVPGMNESAASPVQALGIARAQDMQPIRTRLERILQIKDPDILRDRLIAFLDELPQLLRDINADPEQAAILQDHLRTSLAQGLTTKSQTPKL